MLKIGIDNETTTINLTQYICNPWHLFYKTCFLPTLLHLKCVRDEARST